MLSSPYGAQIPNTPGIRPKSRWLFQTLLRGFIPLEVQPENRFADFTLTKSVAAASQQKNGGTTERLFLFLISIHLQHLLWRPDIYIRSFIVPGIPCDKSLHFIQQRSRTLYGTLKVFPFCFQDISDFLSFICLCAM